MQPKTIENIYCGLMLLLLALVWLWAIPSLLRYGKQRAAVQRQMDALQRYAEDHHGMHV